MMTRTRRTMDRIEQLPAQMTRRNWIILALLLLGSLPFGNLEMSIGILAGGLVAIGGFLWMKRSLNRLMQEPDGGAKFRYQFGYMIRLAALAVILAVLIAVAKVNTPGLIIGLSVVVINLFWITIKRVL